MARYDLYVKTENPKETIKFAEDLGWDGLCFIIPYARDCQKKISELKSEMPEKNLDVAFGVEIEANFQVKKILPKIRKKVELIFVRGGSNEVNREILENPLVDVLTNHLVDGKCGINYVLAKLAKKNNVAILFDFNPVLYSYGKTRAQILAGMLETAKMVKKFNSPFVISSGAKSEWDLRSPSELIAFGKFLGFREPEIKEALSNEILLENRKRLSDKWIMPGVEVE